MPVQPKARPRYAKKARIVGGDEIFKACDCTHEELASLAGCHVNTVGGALKGQPKLYQKAHNIFTAINMKAFNSKSRTAHVEPLEEGWSGQDYELDKCCVFYGLEGYLSSVKTDLRKVAAAVDVEPILVSDALKQKPICEEIVLKIKEHLVDLGATVDPDHIVK